MVPSVTNETRRRTGLKATRIEVLERRWDVTTGCSRGCPSCWARDVALQFGDQDFRPTFHPEVLAAPLHTKTGYRIGVSWGGDLWDPAVSEEDRRSIISVAERTPWHTYMFLTKSPENITPGDFSTGMQDHIWIGTSITRRSEHVRATDLLNAPAGTRKWVSFEPLLSWMSGMDLHRMFSVPLEWVMIGAFTSGGTGARHRVAPIAGGTHPDMVQAVVNAAAYYRVPVFLKNNLAGLIEAVIDPRTGERFRSVLDWRELPSVLGGKELSLYEL